MTQMQNIQQHSLAANSAVGTVLQRFNERTGTTRYYLVDHAFGPVDKCLGDAAEQAITLAICTGSVGGSHVVSGDVPAEYGCRVVELVPRKPS